jgi:hypothetical protein
MPSPDYYRRQSELCLQLALLHRDTRSTFWLVEFAKEMRARAEEAEAQADRQGSTPAYMVDADERQGGGGIDPD